MSSTKVASASRQSITLVKTVKREHKLVAKANSLKMYAWRYQPHMFKQRQPRRLLGGGAPQPSPPHMRQHRKMELTNMAAGHWGAHAGYSKEGMHLTAESCPPKCAGPACNLPHNSILTCLSLAARALAG